MIASKHSQEEQRLAALARYAILDTPDEQAYDDIARLVAHICQTPIAVINFVDRERQWFKSEVGLGVRETPLDISVCAHAILQPGLFIVPDTTLDARFQDNPLVQGEPHLRFYAGALLESAEGLPLGTLCVLDYQPRELTAAQRDALLALSRQVMTQMELRVANRDLRLQAVENARLYEEAQREIAARRLTEEQLRQQALALENLYDALIVTDMEGRIQNVNTAFERLSGYSREEAIGQPVSMLHRPEDRETLLPQAYGNMLRDGHWTGRIPYIRKDGSHGLAETSIVPVVDAQGIPVAVIGANRDITEQVQHLQEIESLNERLQRSIQETHHRVKNNLQIISALAELQVMEGEDTVPISALSRIGQHTRSLAAIHDLLTQQVKVGAQTDFLQAQAAVNKLIPLLEATTGGRRIRRQVEDFPLPVKEGASLVLLIAEIVSNAVKHGRGDIELELAVQGDVARLEVCDDGPGFPADFDPRKAANTGLGLIDSTGRHDLHGQISYENRPTGGARVIVTFPLPAAP